MGASNNNMKAATATYEGFVGMIKVATPVIALIVAFVIYLIA
ncbi:aa3-type cytochrome c oxidase subunit IV [Novosphingobium sp. PASSN1]|nr:aa3-type cytochrome c oxidase subunit IV [Novosphingobium sp. PASSN1]